jgi:3-oxoacyl-[acyl-carrier-protein] synthase III
VQSKIKGRTVSDPALNVLTPLFRVAVKWRSRSLTLLQGLELCKAYIQGGKAHKILLVGAGTQSRILELTTQNRYTAVIFADGAGAICIEAK